MGRQSDDKALAAAAQVFELLAHPTRLRMLLALARSGEARVGELVRIVGGQQSVITNHLTKLRMVGLVEYRKAGKFHHYRLRTPAVAKLLRLVCGPSLLKGPE
jgi:DNA-binding transcriptional ArsR family regulator